MIFFTTFAPSNNNPLVRLARKRWEGRTRSVPRHINNSLFLSSIICFYKN